MIVDGLKRGRRFTPYRRRLSEEVDQTITSLSITLIILIITLSGAFFFLKSQSAQKAYRLSQVKDQNLELQNQKDGIDAKLVEALSFSSIEQDEQIKKMTEPENREYIEREPFTSSTNSKAPKNLIP